MKVGFIGVGHMGGPMCRNIIKGGHQVMVHDLAPEAVAACVAATRSFVPLIDTLWTRSTLYTTWVTPPILRLSNLSRFFWVGF